MGLLLLKSQGTNREKLVDPSWSWWGVESLYLFEVNVKSSCFNGVTILAWDVKGIFVERLLNRNRKPTLIAGDTVLK